MKAENYFNKHGEIYGIEEPTSFCGYAKAIRFTDLAEAMRWAKESTKAFRYLGTKTDSKHIGG